MTSSVRRLWWLLRVAGHDWMWEGGSASETDRLRRMARTLPLHFSDPYWMPAKEIDRIFRENPLVEVTTGPRPVVRIVSTWPVSEGARTWSSSTGTARTWTYGD